jgi:hypothetical protein
MASKSTPGLLKAIEGYTGEHAGSKEHEPIVSQLKRVASDIHKGSAPSESSPGRAAAQDAASKSFQDRMPAEAGHDGGRGNKYSNAPGQAGAPEQIADIAGPDGRSDHLSGVAAVKSAGNRQSNLPSSGLPPGTAEIRRIAAEREMSRKDTHMKPGAHKGGDDNKRSMPPGEGYPVSKRIGDVEAPAAVRSGSQPEGDRAERDSGKPPEQPPVRVPQQRDPFAVAGEQAKKKLAASLK